MLSPKQVEKIANALKKGKRIVDLHPQQAIVYDDHSPIRIVCAGSGWGKTFLSILIMIREVFLNPGTTNLIISPTDKQGYRNIYDTFQQTWDLLKTYDKYFQQFNTPDKDAIFFADGEISFKVPYKNKLIETKVLLLSGYNDKRIRGLRATVVIFDELSFIDNNERLWTTINGRLMPNYKILAISTPPEYYDLLYKLVQDGNPENENKKEGIRSWTFETAGNITDEGLKKVISDSKARMSKEDFEREFEGKFKIMGKSMCKNFNRERNIVNWNIIPDHPICFSSDFNVGCYTTIAFQTLTKEEIKEKIIDKGLKINDNLNYEDLQDEVMFVFKEWKLAGVDTLVSEFCEIATNYLLEINYDAFKYGLNWYGDPHGGAKNVNAKRLANGKISNSWSEIELYFPDVQLWNDKFEEQLDRITNFNAKVKNYLGKTGILINKDCEELIKDIEQVKKTADGRGIDKTREKAPLYLGHLFDCITYAVSYQWEVNQVSPEIYYI